MCARIATITAAFTIAAPAWVEAAIAVTLNWSASPNAAGYYVYAGVQSNNYTTTINAGNTTSLVIYLALRTLKRQTRLLHVKGR